MGNATRREKETKFISLFAGKRFCTKNVGKSIKIMLKILAKSGKIART